MLRRDRIFLSLFIFSFPFLNGSQSPNTDVIARQSGGKVVPVVPGGSVSHTPSNTGAFIPVYEGQLPPSSVHNPTSSNNNTTNNGPGNSSIGGVIGFLYNFGKTSEKDKRHAETETALRKAERDAMYGNGGLIVGGNGRGAIPATMTAEQIAQEEVNHARMVEQYKKSQDLAKLQQVPSTNTLETIHPAIIAATPIPASFTTPSIKYDSKNAAIEWMLKNKSPNAAQEAELDKGAEQLRKFLSDNPTGPSAGELLQGAGGAAAGGWYAYTTGAIASGAATVKAGAIAAGAVIKTGAVVIGTAACAHPFIAAGAAVSAVVGGGILMHNRNVKKKRAAAAVRESIAETLSHTNHEQPSIVTIEGKPRKALSKTERRHPDQNGDPRSRGILNPEIMDHPGQGKPHGFKDDWGHWAEYNTKTHVSTLECFKNGTYLGKNGAGNHVIIRTHPKTGGQEWVYYRDGFGIVNSGINPQHLPINPETNLLFSPEGWNRPKGPGYGEKLMAAVVGTGAATTSSELYANVNQLSGTLSVYNEPVAPFTVKLPDAPPSLPPAPTEKYIKMREESHQKYMDSVLEQYEKQLDTYLPTNEKNIQLEKARKLLAKQNDL